MELIDQIGECYEDIVGSFRTSLAHAVRMGRFLNQFKKLVGHGNFGPWFRAARPEKIGWYPGNFEAYGKRLHAASS